MQISSRYLLVPVALQMLCMALDEFFFHWQRQLPRWERLGHPLDTLTVLLCLAWLLAAPPGVAALNVYLGLCVFSCLFVTKDELVHRRLCQAGEHWLHAVLFILHPLSLLGAGLLWPAWHGQTLSFVRYEGFERGCLLGNLLLTGGFGLYQLVYWNFVWHASNPVKSTTRSITS